MAAVSAAGSSHTPFSAQEIEELEARPACHAAEVSLGSMPGAIDFDVECRVSGGSDAGDFVVYRDPPVGGRDEEGIQAVRGRPLLAASGGSSKRGTCRLDREVVSCVGRGTGRFVFHGRLWVEPQERCDADVAIYVVLPAECGPTACNGSFRMRFLAKGKPSGC
ncbi:MAG TPA: hypothetical protein VGV69_10030 [Solirubrobacterales bacterium]|nr:hypothetical protein [Solirubrobacterales bacterium]